MDSEQKLKGPASYFTSIEKKYGQPIDYWIKLVQKQKSMKHMEVVSWLKTEHGLGHGHANAIVAYCFAQSQPDTSGTGSKALWALTVRTFK